MCKYNEFPQVSDCIYLINTGNHESSSLLLSSRVLILYQDTQRTSTCLCERCYAQQFGNAKFRSLVLSHWSVNNLEVRNFEVFVCRQRVATVWNKTGNVHKNTEARSDLCTLGSSQRGIQFSSLGLYFVILMFFWPCIMV